MGADADKPRSRPYVWASWITKLLAEEDRCWWRAWYKAHFKYRKAANDPERDKFFEEWTKKHDELTARVVKRLKGEGYVTRVEDEGAFTIRGKRGDLAGKPDVVGVMGGIGRVYDAKSGKKRASDHWQVLVYVFGLAMSYLQGIFIEGYVEYRDGPEDVAALGPHEKKMIVEALNRVMADDAPPRAPSAYECRSCDVAACPERFTGGVDAATDLF